VTTVLPRISALVDAERVQAGLWPEAARTGRYEPIDLAAADLLQSLGTRLADVNEKADLVAGHATPVLPLWRVLVFGAWGPLFAVIRAWGDRTRLDASIGMAEETVAALAQQQTLAESVPERVQSDLAEVRAEIRRLYALWEAEVQAGTQDIQALGDDLALVDNAMGQATEGIRSSTIADPLDALSQADQQLVMAQETIQRSEQALDAIRENRAQAQTGADAARASVAAAQRRWAELQARGAQDPAVAARLSELAEGSSGLDATLMEATPAAYARAVEGADTLEALGKTISGELQALDDLMARCERATGASAALVEQAEAAVEDRGDALKSLDLDEARTALAEARDTLSQAQGLRSTGSWHGFQAATTLAEQASALLTEAIAGVEASSEVAQALLARRDQVSTEARQALREKGARLADGWAAYGRHWHPSRQQSLSDALALVGEADAAWSELPQSFVEAGSLSQSGLTAIRDSLDTVVSRYERARDAIDALEVDLERVQGLRSQLETGLEAFEQNTLPALAARRDTMLPELLERYESWLLEFQTQRDGMDDPTQIDYERAALQWLPGTLAEAQAVLEAYDGDLAHYRKLLEDGQKRLERGWQRLQRLNPLEKPLPREDISLLTAEYEAWRAAAEEAVDSPAALSTLATHQVVELERRMDEARTQISDGRQTLSSLERQFQQLTQSVQKSRTALHTLLQDSQWHQISWVLGSGEEIWERALAAQTSSRAAESLEIAIDEMRRALSVGQEAHQVYSGTEQQLRSALDRLNKEFRAITSALDRTQRRAGQIRQDGPSEELDVLDECIAQSMSALSMAQNAASFEDALRYLREAQDIIERG